MKLKAMIIPVAFVIAGCAASTSTELATSSLGERYAATTLNADIRAVHLPYTAILHIPIGVTSEAQPLYERQFAQWLGASDSTSGSNQGLAKAHKQFIASNGLTAPLRSGLDLGILMESEPDFIVAHYVIAEQDGELVRDYLDDPDLFPPSLVHAELQFLSEPRDPLLYTGGGDVLSLGTIGAPAVALAYSPDFSDVFATSEKLDGTTLLDAFEEREGAGSDDLPIEMASFAGSALADTRRFIRGVIVEGINEHADPARMLDDDRDWFDFYALSTNGSDGAVSEILSVEADVIQVRNTALRRIIEAQTGDSLRALKVAEAETYDKRREIADKQTQAQVGMAIGLIAGLSGAASSGYASSIGDTASVTSGEGLMQQGSENMVAAMKELQALNDAATQVVDAFGGFFETSIEREIGGVVETEFGRFDADKGLSAAKSAIRDAVAAGG